MRTPMWLILTMREWGRECRRIANGCVTYSDGAVHADGWPPTSVSAFGEKVSRSTGSAGRRFAEVRRGQSMEIWRILNAAPEEVRSVLFIQYVVVKSRVGEMIGPDQKAEIMGISRAKYFGLVRSAEWYMLGRLERDAERDARIATGV